MLQFVQTDKSAKPAGKTIGLTKDDRDILNDLERLGAATSVQFELRTGRIGQHPGEVLEKLVNDGFVKRSEYDNGSIKVYSVSLKRRLRLI